MEYTVYILRCGDASYYTGITNNLQRRIVQHAEGMDPQGYIWSKRPVELVYSAIFKNVRSAIAWEKQIKRWSRKKKEALIQGKADMLHELSTCKNDTHSRNKKNLIDIPVSCQRLFPSSRMLSRVIPHAIPCHPVYSPVSSRAETRDKHDHHGSSPLTMTLHRGAATQRTAFEKTCHPEEEQQRRHEG